MPTFSNDIGLLLAYFIPGFIFLWAIRPWVPLVENIFSDANKGEKRSAAIALLFVASLSLGMFWSVVRAGTIDKTFSIPIRCVALQDHPAFGRTVRQEPNYSTLSNQGPREAFLLVESREKRPYQFYGNMLFGITMSAFYLVVSEASKRPTKRVKYRLTVIFIWFWVFLTFYLAARYSHYRYMTAITSINNFSQFVKPQI